jgi:hypothetical protein
LFNWESRCRNHPGVKIDLLQARETSAEGSRPHRYAITDERAKKKEIATVKAGCLTEQRSNAKTSYPHLQSA